MDEITKYLKTFDRQKHCSPYCIGGKDDFYCLDFSEVDDQVELVAYQWFEKDPFMRMRVGKENAPEEALYFINQALGWCKAQGVEHSITAHKADPFYIYRRIFLKYMSTPDCPKFSVRAIKRGNKRIDTYCNLKVK